LASIAQMHHLQTAAVLTEQHRQMLAQWLNSTVLLSIAPTSAASCAGIL
jgi:hypothetical protein